MATDWDSLRVALVVCNMQYNKLNWDMNKDLSRSSSTGLIETEEGTVVFESSNPRELRADVLIHYFGFTISEAQSVFFYCSTSLAHPQDP